LGTSDAIFASKLLYIESDRICQLGTVPAAFADRYPGVVPIINGQRFERAVGKYVIDCSFPRVDSNAKVYDLLAIDSGARG
jgi:hypothetical protein